MIANTAREKIKMYIFLLFTCIVPDVESFKNPMDLLNDLSSGGKSNYAHAMGSLSDYDQLYELLLVKHKRHIRPVMNQSERIEVNCSLKFQSILDYDVVKGVFSFSGEIESEWMDQSLSWDPQDHGGLSRIKVQANNLWMPNIGIGNAAETGEVLNPDLIGMFLRVHSNGRVAIKYGGTMRTMCTPNAYYYPFDFHKCPVHLVVFGYDKSEVKLRAKGYKDADRAFLRHAEWLVKLGKVGKEDSFYPTVSVNVHLQRRPGYIFLTTILPLLMLVLLQVLVFLLPAESGERISYSITMFLSYAVFMTIVTDKMPPSNPVSLMSHFLTFLLANGALILIANIFIMNVYHKKYYEDIPRCLRGLSSCILRKHKGLKNAVDPVDPQEQSKQDEAIGIQNLDIIYCVDNPKKFLPDTTLYPLPGDIRWRMVAKALDIVCFTFFISDIIVFIIFFYFLQYNY